MLWKASTRPLYHNITAVLYQQVRSLPDWTADQFRKIAFHANVPARLPSEEAVLSRVQHDWFRHEQHNTQEGQTSDWSLNHNFWSSYKDTVVPLELTTTGKDGTTRFERLQAPLSLFFQWTRKATPDSSPRLYLSQCQLADLPEKLRNQLPIPEIVLKAGRGDIYDSNLWMGLAPTYTPLHRDPNPNLFLQLAGRKVVRLFPPEVGASIFESVREKLGRSSSGIFRGDEMMYGEEKELLEQEAWNQSKWSEFGYEATLDHGEALFIPLGWWHSIKGIGNGVTASVNWWFR